MRNTARLSGKPIGQFLARIARFAILSAFFRIFSLFFSDTPFHSMAATGIFSEKTCLTPQKRRLLRMVLEACPKPAPAVAGALLPAEPDWRVAEPDPSAFGFSPTAGQQPGVAAWARTLISAVPSSGKARPRTEGAALLMAALTPELGVSESGYVAGFTVPGGKAPAGRALALERAAEAKAAGEAALLALWTAAEAGADGVSLGDRVQIVHALRRVGLIDEANAFASEGLAGLK